jgi:sugar transferase (PEP-CTERM/EpsH1 system associated)
MTKIGSHSDDRPLIVHILFCLDFGGMENGIVNLVNELPREEFRHAIIVLSAASDFRKRITREDVLIFELAKRPGKDPLAYIRLYRLLRQHRPALVHTRNIGTLDCALIAWIAGVPVRLHGEHGWDVHDPDGVNRKYTTLRRILEPFVRRFVTVSADLESWLIERVRIPPKKVLRICNGVDTERFRPAIPRKRHFPPNCVVVGSVTRFSAIKDPLNLIRAFILVREQLSQGGPDVRLLMAGDGALRGAAEELLVSSGQSAAAWLPGSCSDVTELLHEMHVFVLGSLREGVSNTVLEAMASGLPVIATSVGGNRELVIPGETGTLVAPGDPQLLADAIGAYVRDAQMCSVHGAAARVRAENQYSLNAMLDGYRDLYRVYCLPSGS